MSLILNSIKKMGAHQFAVELKIEAIVLRAVFTIDHISDVIRSLNVDDECVGRLLSLVGASGVLSKQIFSFDVEGQFQPITLCDLADELLCNIWFDLRSGVTLDVVRRTYIK